MPRSLLVLLAFAVAGCSAFMTRAPHDPRPGQWIVCSDSYGAPMVDTAATIGGIGGGLAAWIIVDDPNRRDGLDSSGDFDFTEALVKTAAVLAIIGGLSYGFSAIAGYSIATKCRKLKAAHPRGYGASLSRTQPEAARL
jgi:hypothetical protein